MLAKLATLTDNVQKNHSEIKDSVNEAKKEIKDAKKEIRNEIAMQISQINGRIDRVERSVQEISTGTIFEPAKCIMIYHLTQPSDETEASLLRTVEHIVAEGFGLPGFEVIRAKRCYGNPGPVKVEFFNENIKVDVLKAKQAMKSKREFGYLYVRAAKTHEERLIELNFRTLMNRLDVASEFRFTGSGRLVPRDEDRRTDGGQGMGRGGGRGRGRGDGGRGRGSGGRGRGRGDNWRIGGAPWRQDPGNIDRSGTTGDIDRLVQGFIQRGEEAPNNNTQRDAPVNTQAQSDHSGDRS